MSLLQRLAGSTDPRLRVLLDNAGKVRDRLDHPQLRDARLLLKARPDVLLLGESVMAFVSPSDTDTRLLPTMVADGLGPSVRTHAVFGGGYTADLLAEFARLAAAHPPKVVIVSLWTRGRLLPWIEHPRFGHKDAVARLRAGGSLRGSLTSPTGADFERYYALPHTSLSDATTIGAHAKPLKDRRLPPAEALALLYAFHHGAPVTDLGPVTALGSACRALGSQVMAYQAPISVTTGERALGPALRTQVEANLRAVSDAFRAGAGDVTVLETGTAFGEDEFVDPTDGSEHLNEKGRRRLSELLVGEIRQRLG